MNCKHTQDFVNTIYGERGHLTAEQVAVKYNTTSPAIRHIWRREMLRRGESPMPRAIIAARSKGTIGIRKHDDGLVGALYAQRGLKSARILAAEFGMSRNAIIGLWQRERERRGEIILKRGANPVQHLKGGRRPGPRAGSRAPAPRKARSVAVVTRTTRHATRSVPRRKLNAFATLFGRSANRGRPKTFSIREVEAVCLNEGAGVPFLDIPPNGCRFALGDWDAKAEFFCGSPVLIGCSYCAPHYALCTMPTQMEQLAA